MKKPSKEERRETLRRANTQALKEAVFWHNVGMCLRMGTFTVGVALVWSGLTSVYRYLF